MRALILIAMLSLTAHADEDFDTRLYEVENQAAWAETYATVALRRATKAPVLKSRTQEFIAPNCKNDPTLEAFAEGRCDRD